MTAETGWPRAKARLLLSAALLACGAESSVLAEVEFEPTLSLGVARTDNLTLSSTDQIYETVYQVVPQVLVTQQSARVTSNLALRLEAFRYHELEDSEVYDLFDGETRIGLAPGRFWLDAGAARSQAIRDPEEPISINRLPITPNRIGQDSIYVGPVFQHDVGQNATFGGNVRRRWVKYDDELNVSGTLPGERLDEFTDDTANLSIDNYLRERGLTWAVRYDSERVRSREEIGPEIPWTYRELAAELGTWLGDSARIFAVTGRETPWDEPSDGSLEDTFWEVGLFKRLGANGTFELSGGHRSFGSSVALNLGVQLRSGNMRLAYFESPTTDLRNPNDRGRLLLLGQPLDALTLPGSSERYILHRGEFELDLDLRHASLSVLVYDEKRDDRTLVDGSRVDNETQSGVTVTASWRVGSRTELSLTGDRARWHTSQDFESLIEIITLGARYDIGPRTTATLEYEYATNDFDLETPGVAYTSRLVSLLITRGVR